MNVIAYNLPARQLFEEIQTRCLIEKWKVDKILTAELPEPYASLFRTATMVGSPIDGGPGGVMTLTWFGANFKLVESEAVKSGHVIVVYSEI